MDIGYASELGQWLRPSRQARADDALEGLPTRYRPLCRPQLTELGVGAEVSLAAQVLRSMGLDGYLAPLVLLVGRGSQSVNNAHAAALDCDACCGQIDEVGAHSLVQLLNEPAMRTSLTEQGIAIPEPTTFVAALHNTTTNEIEGFDLDLLLPAARQRWGGLQPILHHASDQVRRERAPRLYIDPRTPHDNLLKQLRGRANDGAQTRPEWGLTDNAAFVIAPRHRTLGAALQGRSFLHDYNAQRDPDGSLLEAFMTAPMLVTHWINWQYHASTYAPTRLRNDNKMLHNVMGGHIGVFEGNGGGLRIGLSQQSIHDGKRWLYEPLRLTVVVDAPRPSVDAMIHQHVVVR